MAKVMRTDHNETWDAEGNLISDEVVETDVTVEVNSLVVSDYDKAMQRMAEIDAFLLDPDVQTALSQPNQTPLDTQTQNRFNKAMIRQQRRAANMLKGLTIYVYGEQHPDLFDDVSNT